jgi:ribosomal protein S18 acetylase RimI-like enzyme
MGLMLTQLTGLQVEVLAGQIVEVYAAAFGSAPYFKSPREADDFRAWLPRHTLRPAFRFLAAFDDESAALAGFAYGYATASGQWWHEQVRRGLGDAADAWLADAFQVSEVAVAPAHQGRGLGRELLAGLLAGLPFGRAVLSTLSQETVAQGMYRRHGWETLIEVFTFPGVTRQYRIMGRVLREPARPGNGATR